MLNLFCLHTIVPYRHACVANLREPSSNGCRRLSTASSTFRAFAINELWYNSVTLKLNIDYFICFAVIVEPFAHKRIGLLFIIGKSIIKDTNKIPVFLSTLNKVTIFVQFQRSSCRKKTDQVHRQLNICSKNLLKKIHR